RPKPGPDPVGPLDRAPLPKNPFTPKSFGHRAETPSASRGWNFRDLLRRFSQRVVPSRLIEGLTDGEPRGSIDSTTPLLSAPQQIYDATASPSRPTLNWTPPPRPSGELRPPEHSRRGSWHPTDVLVGVDPATGLGQAIRDDLTPVLGSSIEWAMAGVSKEFGPEVLQSRLVHESGREWTHEIPVLGGSITVKVRPIRERTAVLVGPSKSFETDLSTESQTRAS